MFILVHVWLLLCYSIHIYSVNGMTTSANARAPNTHRISTIVVVIIIIVVVILVLSCSFKYICICLSDSCSPDNSKYLTISNNTSCTEVLTKTSTADGYHGEIVGPSGLLNASETCYMNSMVQAIAASELLIEDYDQLNDACKRVRESQMLTKFIGLLKGINSPIDRINCDMYNTNNLNSLMQAVKWVRTSQQDSFQLLSAVINPIQRDINDILAMENMIMPPKIQMLHSFTENSRYNKVQTHLAIALPLCGDFCQRPGVELPELLDAFFRPSKIDGTTSATQMSLFGMAPRTLVVHIQANEWDPIGSQYVKPTYFIKYKKMLNYTFDIHLANNGSNVKRMAVAYRLMAVVHHMGNVSNGHYITYRRHLGQWYLTNDSQVEPSDFPSNVTPYIMVYDKVSEQEQNN